jgi:hypothetical protein
VASRQVANSAWLAELSKIAAKSVTTYKSTSRIIPMIAKICLEVIFVFLFCVFLSCDICIPFVIPIHNSQKSGSAGAVRGPQKSGSAGAVRGSQKLRECRCSSWTSKERKCRCGSWIAKATGVPGLSVCLRDCGTVRVIRDSQRSRNCVPHVLRWVLESSSVP